MLDGPHRCVATVLVARGMDGDAGAKRTKRQKRQVHGFDSTPMLLMGGQNALEDTAALDLREANEANETKETSLGVARGVPLQGSLPGHSLGPRGYSRNLTASASATATATATATAKATEVGGVSDSCYDSGSTPSPGSNLSSEEHTSSEPDEACSTFVPRQDQQRHQHDQRPHSGPVSAGRLAMLNVEILSEHMAESTKVGLQMRGPARNSSSVRRCRAVFNMYVRYYFSVLRQGFSHQRGQHPRLAMKHAAEHAAEQDHVQMNPQHGLELMPSLTAEEAATYLQLEMGYSGPKHGAGALAFHGATCRDYDGGAPPPAYPGTSRAPGRKLSRPGGRVLLPAPALPIQKRLHKVERLPPPLVPLHFERGVSGRSSAASLHLFHAPPPATTKLHAAVRSCAKVGRSPSQRAEQHRIMQVKPRAGTCLHNGELS